MTARSTSLERQLLRDLAKMRKNLNETSVMLAKAAKERDSLVEKLAFLTEENKRLLVAKDLHDAIRYYQDTLQTVGKQRDDLFGEVECLKKALKTLKGATGD